jgi:hypothetical protein
VKSTLEVDSDSVVELELELGFAMDFDNRP